MEGVMQQAQQDTPLAKAQALLYRAFEEPDEQKRIQLAKDALSICPDCADAYVLLAEHATSRKEALRLYEQGVAAGRKPSSGMRAEWVTDPHTCPSPTHSLRNA
jgi:hypothetical protein